MPASQRRRADRAAANEPLSEAPGRAARADKYELYHLAVQAPPLC